MYQATLDFLKNSGVSVKRGSSRQYLGSLQGLDNVTVLFQRVADISSKIEDGSADLGIVGLDRFEEFKIDDGNAFVVCEDLDYSNCKLVIAVPQGWIDVSAMSDLSDLALEFKHTGRELRVATKYPRLTSKFFYQNGINYFKTIYSSGTLEVSPLMGFSDIIVDITSTGTTLRENQLKTIADGTIIESQACLIASTRSLINEPEKLNSARKFIAMIEGYLEGKDYYNVTFNLNADNEEDAANTFMNSITTNGFQGPRISRIYTNNGSSSYSLTIVLKSENLQVVTDNLREIGLQIL
jgi:ATP phosphoribosyltransferase